MALTCYVDASVMLRFVFRQTAPLTELLQADVRVTSDLTVVECLRSLDRARLSNRFAEDDLVTRYEALHDFVRRTSTAGITRSVLQLAADPLPVHLGPLDAIHLATARLLRQRRFPGIVLATHDHQLARAARTVGLGVVGA